MSWHCVFSKVLYFLLLLAFFIGQLLLLAIIMYPWHWDQKPQAIRLLDSKDIAVSSFHCWLFLASRDCWLFLDSKHYSCNKRFLEPVILAGLRAIILGPKNSCCFTFVELNHSCSIWHINNPSVDNSIQSAKSWTLQELNLHTNIMNIMLFPIKLKDW